MMLRSILTVCVLSISALIAGCAAPPVPEGPVDDASADEMIEDITGETPALEAEGCTPDYCCGGGVCCVCKLIGGVNVCECTKTKTLQ